MGFGCGNQEDRWQLDFRSVLGLGALVTALFALAAASSVAHILRSNDIPVQSNIHTIIAINFVRVATVSISTVGIASYLLVSFRSPRPGQLHVHGLVLVITNAINVGVIVFENLEREGHTVAAWTGTTLLYVAWGGYRAVFYKMMIRKLIVLGPPRSRCKDVHFWGNAMITSIVIAALSGGAAWGLALSNVLREVPKDDVLAATELFPSDDVRVSVPDRIAVLIFFNLGGIGICGFLMTATAFMWTAMRLVRNVTSALLARGTTESSLAKVRSTLKQHLLGLMLSLSTTVVQILVSAVDSSNLLGQEDAENLVGAIMGLIDGGGDVAGVLLLSGIGALLWREDPEAGDINNHIRGLLHAAVLTGRADLTFEGEVAVTPSRRCIASFPGKYVQEWKALTWLCERHELSSACVFLSLSDPQQRYGKHSLCSETGSCWCYSLYGDQRPWGCLWFDAWKANIEKAIDLDLELVVVFFPGQVDQGLVEWAELAGQKDLWDDCGLGGSQKGEAAYLRKRGISFLSTDLATVQAWMATERTGG